MDTSMRLRDTLSYMIIVIVTFAALQSVVVVMHEFTHSTSAWLLGYTPSPFSVIWGNPIMLTGWDEGVPYHALFPSAHNLAETIIGSSPLLMHTVIVVLGMLLLQKPCMRGKKWIFHVVYWFVIANFMELIAYIVMRAFASGGDTGHFNRGLGLSPWFLFVGGSLLIIIGLYVLFRKILPLMYAIFARENRLSEWMIFLMTAFFLFLWGSGIRVVAYVYPDPQWMFGLIGFAAFGVVLVVCNPSRSIKR